MCGHVPPSGMFKHVTPSGMFKNVPPLRHVWACSDASGMFEHVPPLNMFGHEPPSGKFGHVPPFGHARACTHLSGMFGHVPPIRGCSRPYPWPTQNVQNDFSYVIVSLSIRLCITREALQLSKRHHPCWY